jgi:hypothetical protein
MTWYEAFEHFFKSNTNFKCKSIFVLYIYTQTLQYDFEPNYFIKLKHIMVH